MWLILSLLPGTLVAASDIISRCDARGRIYMGERDLGVRSAWDGVRTGDGRSRSYRGVKTETQRNTNGRVCKGGEEEGEPEGFNL